MSKEKIKLKGDDLDLVLLRNCIDKALEQGKASINNNEYISEIEVTNWEKRSPKFHEYILFYAQLLFHGLWFYVLPLVAIALIGFYLLSPAGEPRTVNCASIPKMNPL